MTVACLFSYRESLWIRSLYATYVRALLSTNRFTSVRGREKSVTRQHLGPRGRMAVSPVAYLVEEDSEEHGPSDREWVVGIVVVNPFYERAGNLKAKWLPSPLERTEYLVCRLRSWHQLSGPKRSYRLWAFDWAWTSDVLVVQPSADWDDDRTDRGSARATARVERRSSSSK